MTEKLIIKKPICVPVYDKNSNSYVRLNYLNSWDDDFVPIKCDTGDCGCESISYLSTDPRLISSTHNGDKLALDTVPRNGKVQFNCSNGLNGCDGLGPSNIKSYKSVYNTYSDIRGGDITYYYGQDLATPFIPQLFVTGSRTNGKIYQPGAINRPLITKEHYIDPMNSYKPHYCREPIYNQNCLNWIKDSQYYREDLMSKQLYNRNQNNFQVDIVTN
jgi:hypothetical protein